MKAPKTGLPVFAYVLIGVLAISAVMVTFTRRAGRSEPSIGSYGPSGLHLLADLLREAGYEVDATRDPTPRLDSKRDIAVVIRIADPANPFFGETDIENDPLDKSMDAFTKKGGRTLESSIGSDFAAVSRTAKNQQLASDFGERVVNVRTQTGSGQVPVWAEDGLATTTILGSPAEPFALLGPREAGEGLYIADFAGASNRMLVEADNAAVYVSLIRSIAPPGSRLVFLEAAWGNASEPGLFESIGPWAAAGWAQLILLLIVVAYTLGMPFGLADESRRKQSGQRELVDAFAGTLGRAHATDIALRAVLSDADRRLRRALKIDSRLDSDQRNKVLPEELVGLIARVEMGIATRVPPDIAVGLANELDRQVTAFAGDRRQKSRRRRKS